MAGVGEDEQRLIDEFFADVAKKLVDAGYDPANCGELKVEILKSEGGESQIIFTWDAKVEE